MRKGLMQICSAQVSTLVILVSVHTISVLVGEESVAVMVVVCSAAEPVVVFFFVLVLKRRLLSCCLISARSVALLSTLNPAFSNCKERRSES